MASQLPYNSAAPEFVAGASGHNSLDNISLPAKDTTVLEVDDDKSLQMLKDQAVSTLQRTVKSADTLSACCRKIGAVTITNLETHENLRKQVNDKRRELYYLTEGNKMIETLNVCPRQKTCNGNCGIPHTADGSVPEIPAMHKDKYVKATVMDQHLFAILTKDHLCATKTIANSTVSDLQKAGGNRESLVVFNKSVSEICDEVNTNIASISTCLQFTQTLSQKNLDLAKENGKLEGDIKQARQIRYKLKQPLSVA